MKKNTSYLFESLSNGLAEAYKVEHRIFDELEKAIPGFPKHPAADTIVDLGELVVWSENLKTVNVYSLSNQSGSSCKLLNEINFRSRYHRKRRFTHKLQVDNDELLLISKEYKDTYGSHLSIVTHYPNAFVENQVDEEKTLVTLQHNLVKARVWNEKLYLGISDGSKGKIVSIDFKVQDDDELAKLISGTTPLDSNLDDFVCCTYEGSPHYIVSGNDKLILYDKNGKLKKVLYEPQRQVKSLCLDERSQILFGASGQDVLAFQFNDGKPGQNQVQKPQKWFFDCEAFNVCPGDKPRLLVRKSNGSSQILESYEFEKNISSIEQKGPYPMNEVSYHSVFAFDNYAAVLFEKDSEKYIRVLNRNMHFLADIHVPDVSFGLETDIRRKK
jgi:hypothetical protein